MPIYIIFSLGVLFSALYLILIAPLLFKFWIIPRIEERYNKKLIFDNPVYSANPFSSNWSIPPMEISFYLVDAILLKGKFQKNKKNLALGKINYDIRTASKNEIVMAFITVFFIIYFIGACIVMALASIKI